MCEYGVHTCGMPDVGAVDTRSRVLIGGPGISYYSASQKRILIAKLHIRYSALLLTLFRNLARASFSALLIRTSVICFLLNGLEDNTDATRPIEFKITNDFFDMAWGVFMRLSIGTTFKN